MKKEIEVINNWNEVSVLQYQQLQLLKIEESPSEMDYIIDIITILNDVDREMITGLNINNFNLIAAELKFITKPVPTKKKKTIKIGRKTYKWVDGFHKLSVGEMISIEQTIDSEELTYNMAIDVILAVLLREVNDDGSVKEFNSERFQSDREQFSQLKITDVYGMIVFFSIGGKPLIQHLLDYFHNKLLMMKNLLMKRKQ